MDERELTFGENAVGLTFNPSNNPNVDACKRIFAEAIDQMNGLRNTSDNADVKRIGQRGHHRSPDRADVGRQGHHLARLKEFAGVPLLTDA